MMTCWSIRPLLYLLLEVPQTRMGSATGYTGPTPEQLRAAALVPAYGRQLLEVFSLRLVGRAAGGPPCGTVSVFDGQRGQIVYRRERDQPTRHHSNSSRAQDGLMLTGPHRAISAEGSFAITLDLDDGSQEPSPSPEDEDGNKIGKIYWDIYHPSVEYDKIISQTVDTLCGPAEVTYAVLSNAVEGAVEVKLVHGGDGGVCGRIIARSRLFTVGTVLFDCEPDEGVSAGEPTSTMIPLARSVLAVPLVWPLTVEADLRSSSGDEIAKGCLEFYPELEGEHTKRLTGWNGDIEVKIKWWDH